MKHLLFVFTFMSSLLLPHDALSAPWIKAGDTGLRADIELLADAGHINIPLATYPLMWASLADEFDKINIEDLSANQQLAYLRIKKAKRLATNAGNHHRAKLYAASDNKRFSGFETNYYEQNKITASSEFITNHFVVNLAANLRSDYGNINGDDKLNFDQSFIAFQLGNWVVDIGAMDQWWGPGFDTSLIMSNNARPLPAVAIRRNNSQAFDSPWLSWIGPWTFSAQIAQLESERYVADAKLWSSRASFKPFNQLEIGLSWSYQWGGEGQPESFRQFIRGLLGRTECVNGASTCDVALQTKLGNQLAGFDARWSGQINQQTYAIYAQTIGEDSPEPGSLRISDKSYLYGIETQLSLSQNILINLEYSDTQANCGARGDTSQDCFYEHGTYASGYRYYRRSIGSQYDNDAETWVLSLFSQAQSGNQWQLKLRQLQLNSNDRDRYPNDPLLGNSVSKVAEKVKELDGKYVLVSDRSRLTLGAIYSISEIQQASEDQFSFYLEYQHRF